MKRSVFLVIAGVLAMFFGATMFFAPDQMIGNMTTSTSMDAQRVLQWMACVLFSVGVINILSRNDPGSQALRAVMFGNVTLHILGFAVDIYHFKLGFVKLSGVMMGAVVHGVLILGFLHYMNRLRRAHA